MSSGGVAPLALILSGALLTVGGGSVVAGDAPSDEGRRIFEAVARSDRGYGDQQARVSMQLTRKSGATTTRLMDLSILEVAGDGTRTIVAFNSPLDVKGTKVLTYSHVTRDDEQWIYLPAFRRVKQISDANKTTSFMGSEFTYEDINSLAVQLDKFSYHYVTTEDLDGISCFIVDRLPRYGRSAYKRQRVWIDRGRSIVLRVDYYDTKDALLKTLTLSKFGEYLKSFWRAEEMLMTNHQTGDATLLRWTDYQFKRQLSESDFSAAALKR
jgi:outer membrane lipoprotein-sorting protein